MLEELLKKYFGHPKFRPLQEEIITDILNGNDALVLMPTGGGKSVCYQLPALVLEGVTVVISPLISLMKDQVDAALGNGISAAYLNSTLTQEETVAIVKELRRGEIRLLYCAPERFALSRFREFLKTLQVNLFAVDEAHCISEWGHDFRSDYRSLNLLKQEFSNIPLIALTATATSEVADDIAKQLQIGEGKRYISSFNRPNLSYRVERKTNTFGKLLKWVNKFKGESVIVYCFSKKETESVAEKLRDLGFNARAYHAGMKPETRSQNQSDFINDRVDIITATIAFGMGIDKPDVRLVVHYSLPKTIEGYFQETGRAGRDGLESECILFYGAGDQFNQKYFIEQIKDSEQKERRYEQLNQMVAYCESKKCRRKQLLGYFGEDLKGDNCNSCDACLKNDSYFDAAEISEKIFNAISQTGGRFGASHIINVLLGKNQKKIRELNHDRLKCYGTVIDYDKDTLSQVLVNLIEDDYLIKEAGMYPTLSLNTKATDFLKIFKNGEKTVVRMPEPEIEEKIKRTELRNGPKSKLKSNLVYDQGLFEEFRALRRRLAEKGRIPPYVVASDKTLIELAHYLPRNRVELLNISGFGQIKADKYGKAFMKLINGGE